MSEDWKIDLEWMEWIRKYITDNLLTNSNYQEVKTRIGDVKSRNGKNYNFGYLFEGDEGSSENIDDWKIIQTIGQGSCLIHSFLVLLSEEYRKLDYESKKTLARAFRLYLSNKVRLTTSEYDELIKVDKDGNDEKDAWLSNIIANKIARYLGYDLIILCLYEFTNGDPFGFILSTDTKSPCLIVADRGPYLVVAGEKDRVESGFRFEAILRNDERISPAQLSTFIIKKKSDLFASVYSKNIEYDSLKLIYALEKVYANDVPNVTFKPKKEDLLEKIKTYGSGGFAGGVVSGGGGDGGGVNQSLERSAGRELMLLIRPTILYIEPAITKLKTYDDLVIKQDKMYATQNVDGVTFRDIKMDEPEPQQNTYDLLMNDGKDVFVFEKKTDAVRYDDLLLKHVKEEEGGDDDIYKKTKKIKDEIKNIKAKTRNKIIERSRMEAYLKDDIRINRVDLDIIEKCTKIYQVFMEINNGIYNDDL
jgi:hypothetical protein